MTETASPVLETAILTTREFIAPGFWYLGFHAPKIAERTGPARYVAIDVPGPFTIRLPLGVWTIADGDVTFLFREWGDRTSRLARLPVGTAVSLLGPLGNEFTLPRGGRRAVIAAGGLGIVPFWLLGKSLLAAAVPTVAVVGARTRDLIVGAETLDDLGMRVIVYTDDGSAGTRGSVIDGVRQLAGPDAVIYGCGPAGMLRALCEFANNAGVDCQISLEETFGCSMGTCWGCVVPVRRGSAQGTGYPKAANESREYDFARVCADGTVFKAADLAWHA